MTLILPMVLALLAAATPADTTFADRFAAPIERAHGIDAWRSQPAVSCRIRIDWRGKRVLDATMLVEIATERSRFDLEDGSVMIWDGSKAWVSPADAPIKNARFDVKTYPYFLAAPMKLRDPGSSLADLGMLPLVDGVAVPAARLTFGQGVGDTPDDWYVVYRDPENDRLRGLAYIVTYGRSLEEATKEPHAILYGDFVAVDGVSIATRWTFTHWDEKQGAHGEPIGSVTLEGVRFLTPPAGAFQPPADARVSDMP